MVRDGAWAFIVPFVKLRSFRTFPGETDATALVEKQVHRKT